MTHQQAVTVIPAPLNTLERRLRDVTSWPGFLLGLDDVTETSFGRYRFIVKDGGSTREVDVAVVAHPAEHRIAWRSLGGDARFDGELRLKALGPARTRVSLTLTADPAGFLAGLSELLRSQATTAVLDLQRLERMVLQ